MTSDVKPEQTIYRRCAASYFRAVVPLVTVMQLNKIPAPERATKLVELEGISLEDAEAWLEHEMHGSCVEHEAYCPACGGQLTTWQAKWCRHCKLDWQSASR